MAQYANNKTEAASHLKDALVEKMTSRFVVSASGSATFDKFVNALGPDIASIIGEYGPYGLSVLLALLPDTMFGSAMVSSTIKTGLNELGVKLGEAVSKHAKGEQPKKAEEALSALAADVKKEFRLKVDQYGHLHMPDCPMILNAERTMPRGAPRKKGQPDQQTEQPSGLPTVSIDVAIRRKMAMSPCCAADIDATVKKQTAPTAQKPVDFTGKSAGYILGKAEGADRDEILDWIAGLPRDEAMTVIKQMRLHLDSIEELKLLVAIPREKRAEFLSWIEEDKVAAKATAMEAMEKMVRFGKVAWSIAEKAWNDTKQWDETNFKAAADAAQARFMNRKSQQPQKTQSIGFLRMLGLVR